MPDEDVVGTPETTTAALETEGNTTDQPIHFGGTVRKETTEGDSVASSYLDPGEKLDSGKDDGEFDAQVKEAEDEDKE